jgi:glutamate synthase (NADPH/NADH) large chain
MAEDIKPIVASRRVGQRRARRGVRGDGARGPDRADGQDHADPRGLGEEQTMPEAHRAMYAYSNGGDGAVGRSGRDLRYDRRALGAAGLDRNGLRPMRYVVTGDGLLIAGSEVGMVKTDEATSVEKGALGPGQMIAVDMEERRLYHDGELKDTLAAAQPFGEWVKNITELSNSSTAPAPAEPGDFTRDGLRRRQIAAGYTMEESS